MENLKKFSKYNLNLKSASLIFGGETISTDRATVAGSSCVDEHVDTNNNGIADAGERVYFFECE